jgi:hypothetical protein
VREVEQVLTDEQAEAVQVLNQKQADEMTRLLRSFI